MSNLLALTKRLRAVRHAEKQFMRLWAAQCMQARPAVLDRLVDEVQREQAVADPHNHDWSLLYHGSVLDD